MSMTVFYTPQRLTTKGNLAIRHTAFSSLVPPLLVCETSAAKCLPQTMGLSAERCTKWRDFPSNQSHTGTR